MSFKTTVNQQQLAVEMAGAARVLAPEVAEAFRQAMEPYVREGETLPDLKLLQEILSRWLVDSGQQVLAIDDRYSAELRRRQELLARRKVLETGLRLRLRDVRHMLDRQFGKERSEGLFPDRNVTLPRAAALIRTGRQAIEVLRDPELSWVQLGPNKLLHDPAGVAEALEAECNELEQLLDETIKEQKRQRLLRLGDKQAELKTVGEAVRRGANFLGGLYELVGLDFQAKRLRPRRRKSGKPGETSPGAPMAMPAVAAIAG
jgi:hypothetical protein